MATAFYSFNVGGSGGTVSINLASLSPLDKPGVLPETVQLGYGVPAGEGCDVRQAVPTAPALVSQLTETLTIGTYCASITDAGGLTEPANYSIRVTHAMKHISFLCLLLGALLATACTTSADSSSANPLAPSGPLATDAFSGTVDVGGR